MGPEYLALALTAVISAATGGSWVANKILSRHKEQIQQSMSYTSSQKRRIDILEDQINRMPLDYVLKVDFLREIQEIDRKSTRLNSSH